MTRPVCAFITFESDDGKVEALNYTRNTGWWSNRNIEENQEVEHVMFMGADPQFIPTTDPTNIIWENRHIKGISYCARVFSGMLITAFMLFISFIVIIAFKRASIKASMEFPERDCEPYKELGDSELTLVAGLEFYDLQDGEATLNGALQCFCDIEK